MRVACSPAVAATALVWLLVTPPGRADEAVLRDGRICKGTLGLDSQRRLSFTADGKALRMREIETVRLPTPRASHNSAVIHQVHFRSGERLSGELLSLDARALRLRTGWGSETLIPRYAVSGLTNFSNQVLVFRDDFEEDLSA